MKLENMSTELPIGIFDSGVGGLTVMKEVIKQLPAENVIYLGDTARVPYGVRSSETVLRYSLENGQFLMSKGIKLLVVACNTSSAVSLQALRDNFPVPVVGVVEPGARAAVQVTKSKKIAVIGTETTIQSGSYETAIKAIDKSVEVAGFACPLFVPLIEEGWLDGDVVTLTAKKYLESVKNNGMDALVLGCTHYPMIKHIIGGIVSAPLIDSAVETAKEIRRVLEQSETLCGRRGQGSREFYVTDAPHKFAGVGERFLEQAITNISRVSLEQFIP